MAIAGAAPEVQAQPIPAIDPTLAGALARIEVTRKGQVDTQIGTGFWISDSHLVTATHVLGTTRAVGCDKDLTGALLPPLGEVEKITIYKSDAPAAGGPAEVFRGSVPASSITSVKDISVIELAANSHHDTKLSIDPLRVPSGRLTTAGFDTFNVGPQRSSGLIRGFRTVIEGGEYWSVQFTPGLAEAMSGSPILDERSNVVAIHSCGTSNGNAFVTPVALLANWLAQHPAIRITANSARAAGSTETAPSPASVPIIKASVRVYDRKPGEATSSISRPAQRGEVLIEARDNRNSLWRNVETDVSGGFTLNAAAPEPSWPINISAVYVKAPEKFLYQPRPIVASKPDNNLEIGVWNRERWAVNQLNVARQTFEPAQMQFKRATALDDDTAKIAAISEVKKGASIMEEALAIYGPDAIPQKLMYTYELARVYASVEDPCTALARVLALTKDNPTIVTNGVAYITEFSGWVTACVDNVPLLHQMFRNVPSGDEQLWGIRQLRDAVGNGGVLPAKVKWNVLREFNTLFTSLGTQLTTAGTYIADNDDLKSLFAYFAQTWVRPSCGRALPVRSAAEIDQGLAILKREITSGRCFAGKI